MNLFSEDDNTRARALFQKSHYSQHSMNKNIPTARLSFFLRAILLAGLISVLGTHRVRGAISVVTAFEPQPSGELATLVDDPSSKSKKAIEVTGAKVGSVALIPNAPVESPLAGSVTVSIQVRGSGFAGLAEPMRIEAILTSTSTGQGYTGYGFLQGTRLKPDSYGALPLQVNLPAKPATYSLQVVVYVSEVPVGQTMPTAWFSEITVAGHNAEGVYISRVEPDKTAYRPGDEIKTTVTVVNPTAAPFSGKIDLKELLGIDGVSSEQSGAVEAPAGSVKESIIVWKAGPEQAGRQVRAELQDASGRVLDTAVNLYGVSKDPSWLSTLALYGSEYQGPPVHGTLYVGPASYAETMNAINFYRERRHQRVEFFSWSYNELAQFIPPSKEEPYLGNEGIWWMSFKKFKEEVGAMKAMGCTPITYVNGHAWGPAAYDLFQKHPDWFLYGKNGELLAGGGYDMESRELYNRRGEFEFQQKKVPFFYAMFNPVNPDARQYIADQFISVAKEMGFEGARWDVWAMDVKRGSYDFAGNELAKTDAEADQLSAQSYRAVRDLVAKEVPNFTWGSNYGAPEENAITPQFLAEKCRDGGWLLDEVVCTYNAKTSPYHIWEAYADRIISWADNVRQKGGIYDPFGFNRQGGKYPVDRLYETIFKVVGGARTDAGADFTSNLSGKVGRLDLLPFRFSDFYLSKNLKLQPTNQTVVKVKAPDTLWWRNMVFENKSREGNIQRVVHLVNSPVSQEVEENPTSAVREPVRDIEVSTQAVDGKSPVKAWLLTAEPITPDGEPLVQAVPLKLEKTGGGATVNVPSVQFLKTVVFEYGN